MPIRLLLEGRPGAGKTTVARRLVGLIRYGGVMVSGFTTEEIRQGRRRIGFAVESVSGRRAVMAHVDLPGPPRVGKYGVDLDALERVALPSLSAAAEVLVVDELGKMELSSDRFRDAVAHVFDADVAVVATVHRFRHPLTDALKDVHEVIEVTRENREQLPERIADRVMA
jgi:nucleoside-triphosphatase